MMVSNVLKAHLALAFVQLDYGVYHVISKVALSDGINQLVFCIFRDVIALSILGPLAFFKERRTRPPLTRRVLLTFIFLGFTGIYANQLLFLLGLSFTSPAYASAMQPGIPVFTFGLTLCMGIERINWKQRSSIAKVGGTSISILGAVLMAVYKGPIVWGDGMNGIHMPGSNVGEEVVSDRLMEGLLGVKWDLWHIGVLCLIGNCFCMAVYLAYQAPLLKVYPAGLSVTAYSYFFGALFMLLSGVFGARDQSEWVLTRSEFLAVIFAGIAASALNYGLLTWSNKVVGPALVALYMPLQPLFSSILAHVFLNSSLFLGSVLGGSLMIVGLYCVTWGQRETRGARDFYNDASGIEPELDGIQSNRSESNPLLKESAERTIQA